MVGKLLKHELYALFRILVLFLGAALLLAVLTRIAFTIMNSTNSVETLFAFLVFLDVMCLFTLCLAPNILSASLFYRSLFTGEGYLTFSLPATSAQLLISKFLSALIASITCSAVAVIALLISLPIEALTSFSDIAVSLGAMFSEPLFLLEFILSIVVMIPSGFLYLYLVLSIGQLFTRRRTLNTWLLFFGLSFVLSLIFFAIEPAVSNLHGLMWIRIVAYAVFDVGSFFVTRFILSNKVNLVMG